MNMLIYSIALSAISFPFVREAHTRLIDMSLRSSSRDFRKDIWKMAQSCQSHLTISLVPVVLG